MAKAARKSRPRARSVRPIRIEEMIETLIDLTSRIGQQVRFTDALIIQLTTLNDGLRDVHELAKLTSLVSSSRQRAKGGAA